MKNKSKKQAEKLLVPADTTATDSSTEKLLLSDGSIIHAVMCWAVYQH